MKDNIVWGSSITKDMVDGWTPEEIEMLCADLDDAVQGTYDDYNIGDR